jgi:glycosyltransferase involved in cell wall biosynthesis
MHGAKSELPVVSRLVQLGGLAGPGPIAGGVWAVARTQTELLRANGMHVELIGGWLAPHPPQAVGARFIRVRRPFPGAGLRGLWNPRIWHLLPRLVGRPDIAHVHLSRDFLTTVSLMRFRSLGIPVVVQTHGMLTPAHSLLVRLFDRLFGNLYRSVPGKWLALTEAEQASLAAFGIEQSRIVKIPNSVVPKQRQWAKPEAPVFIFVSRLHERKRPAVFVEAAVMMLDSGVDAQFIVAGPDQGELRRIEQMVDQSGHRDKFRILGAVTPDRVEELLASATAMVLPSVGEIVPMVVLEAAAMGTPIILTNDSGMSKDFCQADAAIVAEPNAAANASAMTDLVNSPGLATELSARSRDLFLRKWSEDQLVRSLLAAYEETAQAHRTSGKTK